MHQAEAVVLGPIELVLDTLFRNPSTSFGNLLNPNIASNTSPKSGFTTCA